MSEGEGYDFENDLPPRVATPGPLRLLGVQDGVVHVSFGHGKSFEDGVLQPDEAVHLGEMLVKLGQQARREPSSVARVLPFRDPTKR